MTKTNVQNVHRQPAQCTQADKRRHHWRIAAVTTAWSRLDHSIAK